jgi:hypothetical protein
MHTHKYAHIHICLCKHQHAHGHAHTHARTHAHACTHACGHARTRAHAPQSTHISTVMMVAACSFYGGRGILIGSDNTEPQYMDAAFAVDGDHGAWHDNINTTVSSRIMSGLQCAPHAATEQPLTTFASTQCHTLLNMQHGKCAAGMCSPT